MQIAARRWHVGMLALALALFGLTAPASGATRTIERISVSLTGEGREGRHSALSADGRFVAFSSTASDLIPGGTNGQQQLFLRDRATGVTELISRSSSGEQANGDSGSPALSPDGRFVVFLSGASNLVAGDTNGQTDVFVRDRAAGTTERVNVSTTGAQVNTFLTGASDPVISADGRFVAFVSNDANLVPGDTNGATGVVQGTDVFVRDRLRQTTERVSLAAGGAQADYWSFAPVISADGRFVLFWSEATNLIPGRPLFRPHLYVRDRVAGTTELVSVSSTGAPADEGAAPGSMSADGRLVAFASGATNLAPGGRSGIFLRDRATGSTELALPAPVGSGDVVRYGIEGATLSAGGRYLVFISFADNLVLGDINNDRDIFVYDRVTRRTERIGLTSAALQGGGLASTPTISAEGRFVGFASAVGGLAPGHLPGRFEVFVAERFDTPAPMRIAVFRPSTREWFLRRDDSSATVVSFGGPGDRPVPGNYLGDGRHAVPAVFRATGHWLLRDDAGLTIGPIPFGRPGDIPAPADYLGIGRTQLAVFRPDTRQWLIRTDTGDPLGPIGFGVAGNLPMPADYLGRGRAQIAVFRPHARRLGILRSLPQWLIRDESGRIVGPIPFGGPGDVPVPADYLGTGRAQLAVFRPTTGEWFLRDDAGQSTRISFGAPGDLPQPGDYLGTGRAQLAVYRPATGEWFLRIEEPHALRIPWGGPGDEPVPAPYDP